MDVNDAIAVVNNSQRNSEEKKHLRRLLRTSGISPASFAGTPDFDEILEDFPIPLALGSKLPVFLIIRPFTIKVLEEIGFGRKLLRDIPKPSSKNGGLLLVRNG